MATTLATINPVLPTVIGVAIVGVGGYYVYKKFIKKDAAEADA